MKKPRLEDVSFKKNYKSDDAYEELIKERQAKLLHLQRAVYHQNKRVIIALEGSDASGKGGTISRITEKMDPRGVRVHPISAPTKIEQGIHYLYRFWKRLPTPGHIAIFDRTWYGRVLVERVEGLCGKGEWQRAYQEINTFERMLVDDGVIFIKLFLHVSPDEQKKRFLDRLQDPLKTWKISEEDLRNRKKAPQYYQAINDMFAETDTKSAPWHIIASDNKPYARAKALKLIIACLEKQIDPETAIADAGWVAQAIAYLKNEPD